MNITIKDVAEKADVSPSTVSRVIAGNGRISVNTIARVKRIMEELGYYPNRMAQSLVNKTTNTLGIVLPRPADELLLNSFFPELIRGIVTSAARSGYDILMTTGPSESEEIAAIKRLFKSRRVDGIILMHSRKKDPVISMLNQEQFPFVLVGRNDDSLPLLTVDTDNIQAASDATKHLIDQGHVRIGFVSGPSNLIVSQDRLEGYRKAMKEARLPVKPEWIVEGEFLQESGYRAMSFFMNQSDRPTALIIIDDIITFGVLRGLSELGFHVPDDLCLVSFNNISLTELANPPITSVDIGIYQLGYTAAHSLLQSISGEEMSSQRQIVPHRLVIRESSTKRIQ